MLDLADQLRSLTDGPLPESLRRRILDHGKVFDVFDLATQLLQPTSIAAELQHCERNAIWLLSAVCEGANSTDGVAVELGVDHQDVEALAFELQARFLLDRRDGQWSVYPEVCRAVTETARAASSDRPPMTSALPDIDTRLLDKVATERALVNVNAAVEIIEELGENPVRLLARGAISLPHMKRLAAASRLSIESVTPVLNVLRLTDLVTLTRGGMYQDPNAEDWLNVDVAERWALLVRAVIASTPPQLQRVLRDPKRALARDRSWRQHLREQVMWLYPALNPAQCDTALDQFLSATDVLGLTSSDIASTWASVAIESPERLAEAFRSELPQAVSQVYVQPDLSIVCPGPPAVSLERTLRRFAEAESVGVAATFRITDRSINHALATGMSAAGILTALAVVAQNEVPQPVRYFITEHGERFGRVRVRAVDGGGSLISGRNATEIEAILRDTTLNGLTLHEVEPGLLFSNLPASSAVWMLGSAGYPAAEADSKGELISVSRVEPHAINTVEHPVEPMWRRVCESATTNAGEAWLGKQIEAAIHAKQALRVTVIAEGRPQMEFVLRPTGIANGRMRGRDLKSEVERTLPLASIQSIEPAG